MDQKRLLERQSAHWFHFSICAVHLNSTADGNNISTQFIVLKVISYVFDLISLEKIAL